jgi:hypothetical protein
MAATTLDLIQLARFVYGSRKRARLERIVNETSAENLAYQAARKAIDNLSVVHGEYDNQQILSACLGKITKHSYLRTLLREAIYSGNAKSVEIFLQYIPWTFTQEESDVHYTKMWEKGIRGSVPLQVYGILAEHIERS